MPDLDAVQGAGDIKYCEG